ncbi:MAG: MaoC family dehydratase [Candidatus Baldrarchaeia archaeon]
MERGSYKEIRVGTSIPPLKVTIDRDKLLRYCEVTREVNPIHFDENAAKMLGFDDIVVQGIFTIGFSRRCLLGG